LLDAAGCCCCCYRSEQQQLITCQQLQRKFVSSLSLYTLSCLKGSFRNDMHSRQTIYMEGAVFYMRITRITFRQRAECASSS
jgi:hypothetical protein